MALLDRRGGGSTTMMNFHDQHRPFRRGRFIGLGRASTGHWPINRRCANTLCAYGGLPMVLGKLLFLCPSPAVPPTSLREGPPLLLPPPPSADLRLAPSAPAC